MGYEQVMVVDVRRASKFGVYSTKNRVTHGHVIFKVRWDGSIS